MYSYDVMHITTTDVFFCSAGFLALTQDSQLVLIKQGFLELWLLYMCRAFDMQNNTLTFPDGSTVSRRELDVIFTVCMDYRASSTHVLR